MTEGSAERQLQRVERVIDSALGHLPTADLIDRLLARVVEVLEVDTVVVLLQDQDRTQLAAMYAYGLEEEVHQGVKVPIGSGFAGRVAASRAPVLLDDVGPETVVNPLLWKRGINTLMGVPMLARGAFVGVLHAGRQRHIPFSEDDVVVLQLAADRIANAIAAEQSAVERTAARTLQLSLLPSRLPLVPGLEFATRFVPAEQFVVGGDWFDAFVLPDEQIGVVIGDVAGRGLRAAVVMGRLRSALRAYAMEATSPANVLDRLHRKFAHFEPDEMATVMYLVVTPDLSSFTFSSAGHPPPVLASEGQEAEVVLGATSPPIGSHSIVEHVDTSRRFEPGDTLACYTDGLIERRREPITTGLERLRQAFYAGPPQAVCNAVMSELVGTEVVRDDTALLVVRRLPAV